MKVKLDELTVKFNNDLSDRLIENWSWLTGMEKKVLLISAIGDLFLTDNVKNVYWLDIGGGELKLVANSIESFEEKLKNIDQLNEWFMINLTTDLRLSDKKLKDGQLYSYKKLPILGGEYTVENFAPMDIEAHFRFTGYIHKQIKNLPDGAEIEIKLVD
ncbi:T6SS immunity protein Tdi1 domain-containing protein [Chryseolinea sp. H1M3-3]|uniref:T6SS immunity protein Tdi1 domain-containing protein n=1 Tax=Chryseolinea sp. H1M3-3 TaxID=3034144 RepID=UPI0023ED4FA5|nr:T6SS immunity protein Tdi1 domain-containing protein [Chryseolinea sp. H1M3-3]